MYDLEVGAIMRGGPWDKRHESIRRVYRIDGISPTLTAGGGGGTETKVIIYDNEKESDNLSELIKQYGADEQYDFTYVSLFSGIGGFEQALNKLGGTCVFASEIDKFAAQAYETLYGHMPEGDITQIDAKDVPDHDLLVGGFPCQSFSVAGKRKGFEDTRGTLFFEIARIAKEKRPKALLLENVKGLVNHDKGRTLDVMIESLNEIGYEVEYKILDTRDFGIPHGRERTYIIASQSKTNILSNLLYRVLRPISDFILPSYLIPDKYYYTNENCSFYETLEREITEKDVFYQWRRKYVRRNMSGVCPTLTANMGTGGHNVPLIIDDKGIRKLTQKETWRLQGFSDEAHDAVESAGISDSQRYKQAGNAVTVNVIEAIAERLIPLIS